jgi:peptidoglycan/LPS O-acetylase OafA/YrhL
MNEPKMSPAAPGRIHYEPGLDGLRGVHLLAIFVTHADIGLAPGGFLAVSTFFTLSGFLITSLLLVEHGATDRIDLRAFWVRRVRRLMPGAVLSVTLITILTAWFGTTGQVRRLFGDAMAALGYVANWRFIALGDRYGAQFEGESTLLHFWSLAIEEQFYVVFPVLCAATCAWGRRWSSAMAGVFAVGIVASVLLGASGWLGAAGIDRLYFGTDVRAAEILVGGLVAWWWVPRRACLDPRVHAVLRWAGPAGLLTMLGLISTAHSQDPGWYRGGLVAYACVTAIVVLAAVEPRGPVRSFLSWEPFRLMGLVSYGAYLVHWPVFLWLRPGTFVSGVPRFVLGTLISLGVAAASYRVVELPIRHCHVAVGGCRLGRDHGTGSGRGRAANGNDARRGGARRCREGDRLQRREEQGGARRGAVRWRLRRFHRGHDRRRPHPVGRLERDGADHRRLGGHGVFDQQPGLHPIRPAGHPYPPALCEVA